MTSVLCTQVLESFGIWSTVGKGEQRSFPAAQKEG
jgi:hypothetical protein